MLGSRSRFFFFQAEDGIRDLVRSRGLGDVYKRQTQQFMFPVTIPMIVAIFIAQLAVVNSESPAVLWLSLIHI